jgi:hypothetical protein
LFFAPVYRVEVESGLPGRRDRSFPIVWRWGDWVQSRGSAHGVRAALRRFVPADRWTR